MSTPANELTNRVIHELYASGAFAWRAESTGIMDVRKGVMRTAPKKGVADILGCYKGFFLAVEIKIGSDKQSPEQEGFEKNIDHVKGHYFTAKTFDEFKKWWNFLRPQLDRHFKEA